MQNVRRLMSYLLFLALFLVIGMARAEEVRIYEGSRPDLVDAPTKVSLAVVVLDIDEINSAEQNFTANIAIKAVWKDPRLALEGARRRTKPLDDVWNPRLQILNQQLIWLTMPKIVTIEPDGTVTYRQRYFGKFSNPLNLRSFPFDQHTFRISVVASAYTTEEVQFVTAREKRSFSFMPEKLSLADWEVIQWSAKPKPWVPIPGGLRGAGFEFEFDAKRRVGYFIFKIFVPLVMIVVMSWIVFWLDPSEAGTQISVAITSMLTLIAYRFLLGNLLPPVSYMTQMDYFILGSTALVFTALMESAVTARLAATDRKVWANKIDEWCRWIFPILFSALLSLVLIF